MGRAKILCPHGVLGVANCKICQREQHTARVRELRQKKQELDIHEEILEKEFHRQNPAVVYVGPTAKQSGKATGANFYDTKSPGASLEVAKDMAKHIEGPVDTSPIKSCGACALQEICGVQRRLRALKTQCKGFKPRRG